MPDYIFDTTALSNFAFVEKFELLEKRYRSCGFTTIEVIDELRRGVKAGYTFLESVLTGIKDLSNNGWIQIIGQNTSEEYQLRYQFDQSLDPGEASCLSLAISRKLILITDDLAARRLAYTMNVDLTGTLGILIALVRTKQLSLTGANSILESMIKGNFRSPVYKLDEYI